MLILSRHDVETLLTMPDAIAALEVGFRQLALGKVIMPQRAATPIPLYEGLHLSMPAFVEGDPGTLSIKIVTVYGQNPACFGLPMIQGVILLHDARTGQLLAMMDAEHLTAMRTGAASGVATKYLARPEAKTLVLFGAGAQAAPQVEAVCAVRPIEQVWVITRSGEKDAAFCASLNEQLGIPVRATRQPQEVLPEADVICLATNAQEPVLLGEWVRPGTHINAVGAYHAKMREVDTTTITRSRVFVDHHPAAQSEAGDLLIPLAANEWQYEQVAGSLGELLIGKVAGRTNDQEITFFKSVGLAMQDAMTVSLVYSRALEQGVGQTIQF
jgi:alanine dehydrogenase